MFMNEYDIERSVERLRHNETLGPASRFLQAYMHEVNAHSDGWPYWRSPVKAAAKLMTLIESGTATSAQVRAAMTPIKSFYTRRGYAAGMTLPTLEG